MNVQHTHQRMAAIANGGIRDYAGMVDVQAIRDFDIGRTIFDTLQGRLSRFVIKTRIAKEAHWSTEGRTQVENAYEGTRRTPPEAIPESLQDFLRDECDFSAEHADGSFLDHLNFCYEYTHHHYPGREPIVMFLHSVVGTGTNTFAMPADKMAPLSELVAESAWRQVQAFPSMLRLLYDVRLRHELWANLEQLPALAGIRCHRVIDNEVMQLDAEAFWVQMNYQLIHLLDFVPISNWRAHKNDAGFIIFRDLFNLLHACGQLEAKVGFDMTSASERVQGEQRGLGGIAVDLIPVSLSEKITAKSIRRFSSRIGHSLDYELLWEAGIA